MGGTTFEQYQDGADVGAAFREASDVAAFEHGHGGYTGTLAEKPGYVVITHTPMGMTEAGLLADRLIHDCDPRVDDKWGDAGAIPICKDAETDTGTVTVQIQTGTFTGDWQVRDKELRTAVQKKLKLDPDDILTVTVTKDTPAKARVKAEAPKGKTETRYTITNSQHRNWSTGLASQAEARAKAVRLAEDNQHRNHYSDTTIFEVEAVTRRVDGSPLVQVTRTVPKHDLEVDVTYRKATTTTRELRTDGWLFFGWAST